MGEFLSIGICTDLFIEKKPINSYDLKKNDLETIFSKVIDIEKYKFGENEKYFYWDIKEEYLTSENIINLMKELFKDYSTDPEREGYYNKIYETLSNLKTSDELIKYAKEKPYQQFQMAQYREYKDFNIKFDRGGYYYCDLIIFTLDGKILMECYGQLLRFIEKILRDRYSNNDLAGCIKFMIG